MCCTECQNIQNGIFKDVEGFKKQEIEPILGRHRDALPAGENEYEYHPHNNRSPRTKKFHLFSIAFRFCQTRTRERIPRPIPMRVEEIIIGFNCFFWTAVLSVAGMSVAPNTCISVGMLSGITTVVTRGVGVTIFVGKGVGVFAGVGVGVFVGVGFGVTVGSGVGVAVLVGTGVEVAVGMTGFKVRKLTDWKLVPHELSEFKHARINRTFTSSLTEFFILHCTVPCHKPSPFVVICGIAIHEPFDPESSNHCVV